MFQAALFTSLEATLITLVKTPATDSAGAPILPSHPTLFKILLMLSYFAFILSLSVVISSLMMIDQLGTIPFKSRHAPKAKAYVKPEALLEGYHLSKKFSFLAAHCE